MRGLLLRVFLLVFLVQFALAAKAAEWTYYDVPLSSLKITSGELPDEGTLSWWNFGPTGQRVILDGEGVGYLSIRTGESTPRLVLHAPAGGASGYLVFERAGARGFASVKWKTPDSALKEASPKARLPFLRVQHAYYSRLVASDMPGGAWFRRQRDDTRKALVAAGEKVDDNDLNLSLTRGNWNGQSDVFDLFSGGRAISENLQLDRVLRTRGANNALEPLPPANVVIDSITGITVREFDWAKMTEGLTPQLDPLSASIPHDQHALFFRDFSAALALVDEATLNGVPLAQLTEPRSEDAKTLERYQRQLGLSLGGAARMFGPTLIQSVAVTGSDPYFRTGTDVAVLFEGKDPAALAKVILAQVTQAVAKEPDVRVADTKIGGAKVSVLRSPDRRVSSYVAQVGEAVVVTNSPAQMARLVTVSQGAAPSLKTLSEFTFFRNRYPRGDSQETAFLFLSDATIRRWCGPRWRIASARRTLAAAVLADQQVNYIDRLMNEPNAAPTDLAAVDCLLDLGRLRLESNLVESSNYGSIGFGTPIVELDVKNVTDAERDAYELWRNQYQSNWRQFFDPIGVRIEARPERLAADVTVMPLILGTEYRSMISFAQGVTLKPTAGDPHDALFNVVLAINKKSEALRNVGQFARSMAADTPIDPLGCLGESVSLFIDDDPLWNELAKASKEERDEFLFDHIDRIPIAVQAEVTDGVKLAAFLVAVRVMIEQSAPNMLRWETLKHGDESYVKIAQKDTTFDSGLGRLAVYYYAAKDTLVVSLSEAVLQRAMDRQVARRVAKKQGKPAPAEDRAWLGQSVGARLDAKLLRGADMLGGLLGGNYRQIQQAAAWANLPILNEWRTRYPDQNPLVAHERFCDVRLVCPGGGKYVWNEKWKTMESTVYGHPGEPKEGPALPAALESLKGANFGLTFEENGLRGRVELDRNVSRPK